jgi:hypothetical protein
MKNALISLWRSGELLFLLVAFYVIFKSLSVEDHAIRTCLGCNTALLLFAYCLFKKNYSKKLNDSQKENKD